MDGAQMKFLALVEIAVEAETEDEVRKLLNEMFPRARSRLLEKKGTFFVRVTPESDDTQTETPTSPPP